MKVFGRSYWRKTQEPIHIYKNKFLFNSFAHARFVQLQRPCTTQLTERVYRFHSADSDTHLPVRLLINTQIFSFHRLTLISADHLSDTDQVLQCRSILVNTRICICVRSYLLFPLLFCDCLSSTQLWAVSRFIFCLNDTNKLCPVN